MAKFKPCNEDQLVMLPISLQDQLVPGTLEHTLNQLVDKHIDLSVFEGRYNNDETGATAIHPKILLKVILLAYSRGMISSRQIERACQENIIFIALSYGYAPDHSTLAQFISSMQSEVQTLFSNILLVVRRRYDCHDGAALPADAFLPADDTTISTTPITACPFSLREWIIVWAYRRPSPQSALYPSGMLREEHGENLFKISVNSVFSVVRKCLAHSFSHSLSLMRFAQCKGSAASTGLY